MPRQPHVAFVAGALSVALLWGASHWAPGFDSREPSPPGSVPQTDHTVSGPKVPRAVQPAIQQDRASGASARAMSDAATRSPADASFPLRALASEDAQTSIHEVASQTLGTKPAASDTRSSTDRSGAGESAADDAAWESRSDAAPGSGAEPGSEGSIVALELGPDRHVLLRWASNESFQADVSERSAQPRASRDPSAPAPPASGTASSPGSALPSSAGAPRDAGATSPGASEAPVGAAPATPAAAMPGEVAARALDAGGRDPTILLGPAGSQPDVVPILWQDESPREVGVLPGPAFASRAAEAAGGPGDVQPAANAIRDALGIAAPGSAHAPAFEGPAQAETLPGAVAAAPASRAPSLMLVPIPEPGTVGLVACGIGAVALLGRRRGRAGG